MTKRPRTGFHGIGRDTNAERVVLYTVLGSICLFLPAVRVIADTTFERHIAADAAAPSFVHRPDADAASPLRLAPQPEVELDLPDAGRAAVTRIFR